MMINNDDDDEYGAMHWPVLLKFLLQTIWVTLVILYSGRLMLGFISITDGVSVLQWNTRSSVVYASVSHTHQLITNSSLPHGVFVRKKTQIIFKHLRAESVFPKQ